MTAVLRLLGPSPAWLGDAGAQPLPNTLPGWTVALLALTGDWIARERLLGLLWPDAATAEAQHNLRVDLHRVRVVLAAWGLPDALEAERRRVRLALPNDAAVLRRACVRGTPPLDEPGELLSSMDFAGFPALQEWAALERQALAQAWQDALLRAASTAEARGDARAAASLLLRLTQAGTATEDAMQRLLRVAQVAGRRDEALAAFERFRLWLGSELGLQPMTATIALADDLRLRARSAPRAERGRTERGSVPRGVVQPPRVIGREREIALVADVTIPLLAIGGEPGVGKTRVLEDALPIARWIACREGQATVPLAPLIEHLRDFRDSLPDPGEYRRDLARLLPELAAGERLPPADPLRGAERLLQGLVQVLEADGRALVFDDVQWADGSTAELVLQLARRARVPLRIAYRSTEATPALLGLLEALEDRAGLRRLMIEPLSAEGLQCLLTSVGGPAPVRFGAWLHRRTGGNPFFALQTLRTLFENRRLPADTASWGQALEDVTDDYASLGIPTRVVELVQRRLRALGDTARRVLGVVAVAGSARDVERIAAAVGLSPWATAEALAEAESAGLLKHGRFAHDVVRESHLAGLAEPLRVVLHAAVARQFSGAVPPAQVAAHWWAAGQSAAALACTMQAVRLQREAGLHESALALIEDALARMDSAVPADIAQLDAAWARTQLERLDFDVAEQRARCVLDAPARPADRAGALLVLGELAVHRGRLDEAARCFDEAAQSDPDDLDLLINRGRLAMMQGRMAEMVPALERERDRLRRAAPDAALVSVLTSLGSGYDELGDAARGLPMHLEAWRLAQRLGMRYAQVDVAVNLLWALSAFQRDDEGIALAQEALALGDYEGTPTLRNNLAWSLMEKGRDAEACQHYEVLAEGVDPSLAVIARARLVALYQRAGLGAEQRAMLSCLLDALRNTELRQAHVAAAIAVLGHGSDDQVRAVLPMLEPPSRLDPWLTESLRKALRARGFETARYLLD
jgi:DNA-binding SARP family transcriptional activator